VKPGFAVAPGRVARVEFALADGAQLAWHLAGFDPHGFDPHACRAAGVALPPSVARSVRLRQAGFVHGRLCARAALAELGMADAQVGMLDNGAPAWPAGTTGSISHTAALAAAVALPASACRGVGIDLEERLHGAHAEALAGVAVSPAEQRLLDGLHDRGTALLLVFSAKESFYKAVSAAAGRYFGFEALELLGIDERALTFRVAASLTAHWRPGATCRVAYALGPAYVATAFAW
jgi:enterobactin synthetase component D